MDLSADAAVFLNSDEFAESVTYTPQGGAGKPIKAIVDRKPLSPVAGGSKGNVRPFAQDKDGIIVANHATLGVTSVKERFDTVTYKPKLGGSNQTVVVSVIKGQDMGMWYLELSA